MDNNNLWDRIKSSFVDTLKLQPIAQAPKFAEEYVRSLTFPGTRNIYKQRQEEMKYAPKEAQKYQALESALPILTLARPHGLESTGEVLNAIALTDALKGLLKKYQSMPAGKINRQAGSIQLPEDKTKATVYSDIKPTLKPEELPPLPKEEPSVYEGVFAEKPPQTTENLLNSKTIAEAAKTGNTNAIEVAEGWKPGMKQEFDSALLHHQSSKVKDMLSSVPQEYKQRFAKEIGDLIGYNPTVSSVQGKIEGLIQNGDIDAASKYIDSLPPESRTEFIKKYDWILQGLKGDQEKLFSIKKMLNIARNEHNPVATERWQNEIRQLISNLGTGSKPPEMINTIAELSKSFRNIHKFY
jgi:hypothetical protein